MIHLHFINSNDCHAKLARWLHPFSDKRTMLVTYFLRMFALFERSTFLMLGGDSPGDADGGDTECGFAGCVQKPSDGE